MNKEEIIKKLHEEGFVHVYEWEDAPNSFYAEHLHQGRVSFYVTKGIIEMNVAGKKTVIREGQRFDVPVAVPHSAVVGDDGCGFIVGEEIEGDS